MTYNPIDMTDADYDTLDLNEAARMASAGVCSICEDALDPLHPRWANKSWPRTVVRVCATCGEPIFYSASIGWGHVAIEHDRHKAVPTYRATTAAEYAASVGPVSEEMPQYHASCWAHKQEGWS